MPLNIFGTDVCPETHYMIRRKGFIQLDHTFQSSATAVGTAVASANSVEIGVNGVKSPCKMELRFNSDETTIMLSNFPIFYSAAQKFLQRM